MGPCPDITKDTIAWLRENYPLPVWQGAEAAAPEYHRRVGIYELTEALAQQVAERDDEDAEDAHTAL